MVLHVAASRIATRYPAPSRGGPTSRFGPRRTRLGISPLPCDSDEGIQSVAWEDIVSAVHVIGDIHGEREKLQELLRGAELIDKSETWSGGDSTVWFMGDLVNHGPDGIGVVDLVMGLQ